MLYKPKNMIPSTNTPYKVIDSSVENKFSCIVSGDNSISKYRLKIYRLSDNVIQYNTTRKALESPFYPINYDNTINVFEIPVVVGATTNTIQDYKWTIEFWETGNETDHPDVISSEEVFYAYAKQTLEINETVFNKNADNDLVINNQEKLITAIYTSPNNTSIQWFGWKLTNVTTGEILINSYDSNHIYGIKDNIAVKCEGLMSGKEYKLECKVLDANDCEIIAEPKTFSVEYNTTSFDGKFTATPLPQEQGVLIDIGGISVIGGKPSGEEKYAENTPITGKKSLNTPVGEYVEFSNTVSSGFEIENYETIIWSGQINIEHGIPDWSNTGKSERIYVPILSLEDSTGAKFKRLYLDTSYYPATGKYASTTSLFYINESGVGAGVQITPPYSTIWYIVKISNVNYGPLIEVKAYKKSDALYPSDNTFPSDTLYPSNGSNWEVVLDVSYVNEGQELGDVKFNKLVLGKENSKIGLITDMLYVGGNISWTLIDSNPPTWDESTKMIANFDGNLVSGNVDLGQSISGNKLYKQKAGSSKMEFVKEIGTDESYIVDYKIKNNCRYTYHLFPTVEEGNNKYTLLPLISNTVEIKHSEWSLMVADETNTKNVYTLAKLFKFGLNINSGSMSTNNETNVLKNFTLYPKIQKGNSNYWSGSLSSLIGFVHCIDDYVQTPNMLDELKSLAIDGRKKFLRDLEGHLFEVEIIDSIDIENDDGSSEQVKTMNIKWVETGSAEDVSVVNPRQTAVWLLTNTGTPLSYHTYVWDDSAEWDDNKYWTESIIPDNENTYLGRDIDGGDSV